MVTQTSTVYRYRLSETDSIEFVDRWWLAFAAENGAADLSESAVVGRSLWDFIPDSSTRALYREIHQRVRSAGHPIVIPFRCDSPTVRREMELTICCEPHDRLLYESKLIRARPQRRMSLLDPTKERSAAFLTLCSVCKRTLIEPFGWLEIDKISLNLRLYKDTSVPQLRYTVCPMCSEHATARICERN